MSLGHAYQRAVSGVADTRHHSTCRLIKTWASAAQPARYTSTCAHGNMAPTPVPLPRHVCDKLGLGKDEAAFREGSATIVLPSKEAAFLNPVQEFNRDLSVLAIRTWGSLINSEKKARFDYAQAKRSGKANKKKRAAADENARGEDSSRGTEDAKRARTDAQQSGEGIQASSTPANNAETTSDKAVNGKAAPSFKDYRFTILEALSATGLRSIRYAREIPQLRHVVANDLSSSAVDAMKRNVALNFPAGRPIEAWVPEEPALQEGTKGTEEGQSSEASSSKKTLDETVIADIENALRSGAAAEPEAKAELSAEAGNNEHASNGAAPSKPDASTATPSIHPDCKVRLNEGDAITLMYMHREEKKRFDVVDLDPYGSATMFLDAAVQSVNEGGLLCVTCTDSAVLAGTGYPEKAYSNYGGVTTKAEYSHEMGLRLVLHAISSSAARYGRYIEPLLSLSIDFYVRLFVRVHTRPIEVKRLASKTGCVLTCSSCQLASPMPFGRQIVNETRTGQEMDKYQVGLGPSVGPYCPECGSRFHTAGPMWLGKLHDVDFCKRMLSTLDDADEAKRFKTAARIRGMVGNAADELPGDKAPFYFTPSKLSNFFHTQSPALSTVVSALLHAGYEVSRAHAIAGSLKTTAPRDVLYDMYRAWIKRSPVRLDNISKTAPSYVLLTGRGKQRAISRQEGHEDEKESESAKTADETSPDTLLEPKLEWNLDEEHPQTKGILEGSLQTKGTKYQLNPLPNWGPGTAARSTPRAKA